MEGFGYEKKIRIMIVDENAEFRSYTANKLREEGFDVVLTTSDPKNALDAIEATSPDVVLFDLIMVGLDGIAFLEQAGKMPFCAPSAVYRNINSRQRNDDKRSYATRGIIFLG